MTWLWTATQQRQVPSSESRSRIHDVARWRKAARSSFVGARGARNSQRNSASRQASSGEAERISRGAVTVRFLGRSAPPLLWPAALGRRWRAGDAQPYSARGSPFPVGATDAPALRPDLVPGSSAPESAPAPWPIVGPSRSPGSAPALDRRSPDPRRTGVG